jgi:phospholipase/lecithinase/hemolysin
MSKRFFIAAALLLLSSFPPLFAGSSDVQVVGATVADTEITFHVENSNATAQPVRVQVEVLVADGSTRVVTTGTVTVPATGTATVSASAGGAIVAIIEEPEPISQ